MGGFAAACYMRGLPLAQCPTTLLAMVDASVGGKTGVDLPQGKNLVGAFKQPEVVLADVDTLDTLPAAEFSAGMAEVIKHGLIASPALLRQIREGDVRGHGLVSLLLRAIPVKIEVVESDPFEAGRRAILNLGHTFGHAIEQASGYGVRHGEAVAMGLVCAAHLSAKLGHCRAGLQGEVERLLEAVQLPARIPGYLPAEKIFDSMGADKKKKGGKLRFVLMREVGDIFVTADVPREAVLETIQALRM
jgi:3-dehydroquinate synthetase